MKLDTKAMRHLTAEDWKVLTAVETGSKNHELVPTAMIEKLSRVKGGVGGVQRSISVLAKFGLITRMKEAKYDGYRLTYGGLDYLALHTHASRKVVYSVGSRVGVGKESDIMVVADHTGVQRILKIHRLGRISFRTVKANRDYLKKNKASGSWMYLSRLAAMKEFAFMKALKEEGFPVPDPLAQSRHTIVMTYVDGFPLRQISSVQDPAGLYADLIGLILRLARHGLIHGDFNEFNVMIQEEKKQTPATPQPRRGEQPRALANATEETVILTPVVIDFPQMVSMEHQNAEMYFDRDVNCVKRIFERRFNFVSTQPGPFFKDAKRMVGKDGARRLDAVVEASGFTKKMLKDLEKAIREQASSKSTEEVDGEDLEHEDEDVDDDVDDVSEEDDEAGEENVYGGVGNISALTVTVTEEEEASPGQERTVVDEASAKMEVLAISCG